MSPQSRAFYKTPPLISRDHSHVFMFFYIKPVSSAFIVNTDYWMSNFTNIQEHEMSYKKQSQPLLSWVWQQFTQWCTVATAKMLPAVVLQHGASVPVTRDTISVTGSRGSITEYITWQWFGHRTFHTRVLGGWATSFGNLLKKIYLSYQTSETILLKVLHVKYFTFKTNGAVSLLIFSLTH